MADGISAAHAAVMLRLSKEEITNIKGMKVITMRPNTIGIHKPGEKMEIASFDRTYDYLKTILGRL